MYTICIKYFEWCWIRYHDKRPWNCARTESWGTLMFRDEASEKEAVKTTEEDPLRNEDREKRGREKIDDGWMNLIGGIGN